MVHESMRNLRFDKRLLRRRGWMPPEELEKEIAALPDAESRADRIPVLETEREPASEERPSS